MTSKKRKKRRRWIFAIVLVAALALGVYLSIYRPPSGPIRITVSKETTHILGPVNADGTVNYVAYLNAKHSEGVTKENNAAIPLIEIFGPDLLPEEGRKICEILKIEFPSKTKKYFIPLEDYIEKNLSDKEAEAWDDTDDLDKVTTRPWRPIQYPAIAGWLKANEDALNAALVAMERPRYYVPPGSLDPGDSLIVMVIPDIRQHMYLGNALSARAMLKLDSDDTHGAWADLMAARRLARLVGSGYSLVEGLVALAIEERACKACRVIAGSGKLTGAQARAFLTDMQRLGPVPDLIDRVDEGERFMALDCVMMLARTTYQDGLEGLTDAIDNMSARGEEEANPPPSAPRRVSLEWDKILLKMNPFYDGFVAAAGKKTFDARMEALAANYRHFEKAHNKPRSSLDSVLRLFRDPTEEVGDFLVALLIPAINRAVVLRDRGTAERDLAMVAMALAAYRAEKNAYPDKLSQLAPGYLKEVPDDLFIDKPFGYERNGKGYLLYSVGENMKYDGEKKSYKNDDIVVRVE